MDRQMNMLGVDERIKTYLGRCQCYPCWCARCTACNVPLTKHAFTEDGARLEAAHALDVPGHFQHKCKAS